MPDPMYRQIAEDLRQKIEAGHLAHGAQLPTEFELREQYDASRNTVRDALKLLITRGLVETRPGQGTFVVEKIDPLVTTLSPDPAGTESVMYLSEVAAQHRIPETTAPRVEIQQAGGAILSELRLKEHTSVVSRHHQRFIDDMPWSLQTSFYPMNLVMDGARRLIEATDIDEGEVRYLTEVLGFKQVGYRDTITVRSPDPAEAAFFKLPDDGRVAVFEILRTSFDQHGEPFVLTITVYPSHRNRFVINVGNVPSEKITRVAVEAAGQTDVTARRAPGDGGQVHVKPP
jgi:GntR family transcriptional regulator